MPTNEVLLANPQSAVDLNMPCKSRWPVWRQERDVF